MISIFLPKATLHSTAPASPVSPKRTIKGEALPKDFSLSTALNQATIHKDDSISSLVFQNRFITEKIRVEHLQNNSDGTKPAVDLYNELYKEPRTLLPGYTIHSFDELRKTLLDEKKNSDQVKKEVKGHIPFIIYSVLRLKNGLLFDFFQEHGRYKNTLKDLVVKIPNMENFKDDFASIFTGENKMEQKSFDAILKKVLNIKSDTLTDDQIKAVLNIHLYLSNIFYTNNEDFSVFIGKSAGDTEKTNVLEAADLYLNEDFAKFQIDILNGVQNIDLTSIKSSINPLKSKIDNIKKLKDNSRYEEVLKNKIELRTKLDAAFELENSRDLKNFFISDLKERVQKYQTIEKGVLNKDTLNIIFDNCRRILCSKGVGDKKLHGSLIDKAGVISENFFNKLTTGEMIQLYSLLLVKFNQYSSCPDAITITVTEKIDDSGSPEKTVQKVYEKVVSNSRLFNNNIDLSHLANKEDIHKISRDVDNKLEEVDEKIRNSSSNADLHSQIRDARNESNEKYNNTEKAISNLKEDLNNKISNMKTEKSTQNNSSSTFADAATGSGVTLGVVGGGVAGTSYLKKLRKAKENQNRSGEANQADNIVAAIEQ